MNTESLLFTVSQASDRLELGRSLVYKLVMKGEIASIKVGRARRIPAAALDQFVVERLAESHRDN